MGEREKQGGKRGDEKKYNSIKRNPEKAIFRQKWAKEKFKQYLSQKQYAETAARATVGDADMMTYGNLVDALVKVS